LLGDQSSWKEGNPIGLLADANPVDKKVQQLLCAYQFLQVPIEGSTPALDLQDYTLDNAWNALLGPRNSKEATIVILDAPPDDLEGTNDMV
jgi:hypothetical protein